MALSRVFAVVTGAASGLGHATASHLAKNGAKVLIVDLPTSQGEARAKELGAHFAGTNVTSEQSVLEMLQTFKSVYGRSPNTVVNCAGVAIAKRVVSKKGPHDLASIQKVLEVNVLGTFNVIRLSAVEMMDNDIATQGANDNERGVIINTSSIAAYEGQIGQAAYSASKGAVIGMCLPIAREFASSAIRVNTIAPGVFRTPLVEGLPPQVQNEMCAHIPFPSRLGEPRDFASLVASVIQNPYLNGETIRLDGALRMGA